MDYCTYTILIHNTYINLLWLLQTIVHMASNQRQHPWSVSGKRGTTDYGSQTTTRKWAGLHMMPCQRAGPPFVCIVYRSVFSTHRSMVPVGDRLLRGRALLLALFPGPAQFPVTCSMVIYKRRKAGCGTGNEATLSLVRTEFCPGQ